VVIMGDDHRTFARAAQLLEDIAGRHPTRDGRPLSDDNSRRKVQNVREDSSATRQEVPQAGRHLVHVCGGRDPRTDDPLLRRHVAGVLTGLI